MLSKLKHLFADPPAELGPDVQDAGGHLHAPPAWNGAGSTASAGAQPPRSGAMRRRIQVFLAVFLVCLAVSQALNFSRRAVYMANARVQITPAGKFGGDEGTGFTSTNGKANANNSGNRAASPLPVGEARQAFLTEVEVLNSRPLLEKAVVQLRAQGLLNGVATPISSAPASASAYVPASGPIASVQWAQDMLTVQPVEGTPVVQIQAQGPDKSLLAPLVNALIDVYRESLTSGGEAQSQEQLTQAQDEARVIDRKLADKRRALDAAKLRGNIVSGERDENQTVARLKGLSTSLAAATEREAVAAGRVRALEGAINDGKRAPTAKDNPTVAGIEARLSQMKEEWRALERQFTPQYLDMDPNARALKTRIGNLEQQLEGERLKSQQMALADAREELASAQATAQRLQQQMGADRQEVQSFGRRFGEVQAVQDELQGLERTRQLSLQKLLALESGEGARKPRLLVLEPATTPDAPWQPQYWRDAGLGLLGSLALGILAVWFVEFFNRREPASVAPPTVVVAQPWMGYPPGDLQHGPVLRLDGQGGVQGGEYGAPQLLQAGAHGRGVAPAQLTHGGVAQAGALREAALRESLPRELMSHEVSRLLAGAAPEQLPLLTCLLCGLTASEAAALQVQHVDAQRGVLHVPGVAASTSAGAVTGGSSGSMSSGARSVPLPATIAVLVPSAPDAGADPLPGTTWLLAHHAGQPLDVEEIASVVTSSALDAGLDAAHTITPETLRHTYIAFLVRQGLRFSELGRQVGRLNSQVLNELAVLAPDGPRVSLDQVQSLLPGVPPASTHIQ